VASDGTDAVRGNSRHRSAARSTGRDSAPASSAKAALRNKQFETALEELKTAADHGDRQSEYLLGLVYASGVGTPVSPDEARRWLTAAAEKSDGEAAFALAGLLADGSDQDRESARQWLARAASEGQSSAAVLLASKALPLAPSRDPGGDPALARQLLIWAIRQGDPDSVDAFAVAAGVESVDEFGRSPLAYAVMGGSEVAVQRLLAAGADPGHADQFGVTPLMLAAEAESDDVLDVVLQGKGTVDIRVADIRAADSAAADNGATSSEVSGTGEHNGGTAAQDGVAADAKGSVRSSVRANAVRTVNVAVNIDAKDSAGDTALFYAARVGRTGHVKRLISAGAAFDLSNGDGWTALDMAAKGDHPETVDVLRQAGASGHLKTSVIRETSGTDPTRPGEMYEGWPQITIAASRNDAKLVAQLLGAGARADELTPHRDTALLVAAKYQAPAVVAPLLKAGANPASFDDNGETALGYAAAHGELAVLDILLQKGVSPDTRGSTEDSALVRATRVGDETAVKRLIDAGADVNSRSSSSGTTALMIAAVTSNPQVMQLLITAGSRTELADKTGHDALWFAADVGSDEAVDLLLAAGAPVETNRTQQSPLFAAVHARRAKVLEHLLRKGLSPDAKSEAGDTPLIAAAAEGDIAVVRVLIEGGAGMDVQNAVGNTALIVATREGHANVCQALLKAGANTSLRNRDRIDALDTAKRRNLTAIVALLDTH
jgi:ankyrin repeat protein